MITENQVMTLVIFFSIRLVQGSSYSISIFDPKRGSILGRWAREKKGGGVENFITQKTNNNLFLIVFWDL